MELKQFVSQVTSKNLRNSVFVDITANDKVAMIYPSLLEKSVSVVACNKIACSSVFNYYTKLKDLVQGIQCTVPV